MTNREQVEVRRSAGTEPDTNGQEAVERTSSRRVYPPPTDILESNEDYVLTVDVPGADPGSLEVTYENDVLTIRAACAPKEHEGYALAHGEFELGDYQRAFEISEKVDADGIEAGIKHGVLTIRLPKARPARRKVAITAG